MIREIFEEHKMLNESITPDELTNKLRALGLNANIDRRNRNLVVITKGKERIELDFTPPKEKKNYIKIIVNGITWYAISSTAYLMFAIPKLLLGLTIKSIFGNKAAKAPEDLRLAKR